MSGCIGAIWQHSPNIGQRVARLSSGSVSAVSDLNSQMDFLLVIGAKHTAKSPEGIFRKISDLNLYSDHVLQNGFSPGNWSKTYCQEP